MADRYCYTRSLPAKPVTRVVFSKSGDTARILSTGAKKIEDPVDFDALGYIRYYMDRRAGVYPEYFDSAPRAYVAQPTDLFFEYPCCTTLPRNPSYYRSGLVYNGER